MWKTSKRPEKPLTTEEAQEKALNLLEYRAHSRKEIFDKLRRFTTAEIAAEVVERLTEGGVLDDENFAYVFAYEAAALKYHGPVRIKRELSLRGIDADTAENALWLITDEIGPFEDRLDYLLAVKFKDSLFDEKNRAKTVQALFRLGYEYGMIKNAIYKVKEEIMDEWNGNEGE